MERMHVKGNTWCLVGRQLIPYYQIDDRSCILLDSGRSNDRKGMVQALNEAGLTPAGIVLSHMHYDHHENTKFLKEMYGIPAAMPRAEAEICRNARTLKNHLYNFTPGLIAGTERLQSLICPIERPIEMEETELDFQGVNFGIFHSPGHSPDHICIITPDNVAYMGDALMAGQDLEQSQIPFVFEMKQDLETKRNLLKLNCDRYIVAHTGVVDSIKDLVEKNIALILRQIALMRSLITRPMNISECYETINQELNQADVHPIFSQHLERYLRPYLDYLVDTKQVDLVIGKGSPTLQPLEWQS